MNTNQKFSVITLLLSVILVVSGCKDLTGRPGLPAGTPNPSIYNTAAGAIGMRNAAIFEFEQALPQYVVDEGLLTDELEDANTGVSQGILLQNAEVVTDPLDERIFPVGVTVASYGDLQGVREFANQAIGALAIYDTATVVRDSVKVLRGELYALEGYTEIMLADLFCSGVPLSTLDFQKDFTYAKSSTTAQVYQDAIFKFDTAIALASASDSVVHLAQVGKGRAYLDLGHYDSAATAVAHVPDGFTYLLAAQWKFQGFTATNFLNSYATVSDHEGLNGLPYRSAGDPRTAAQVVAINQNTGDSLYFPTKYNAALSGSGYAPFTLASGVEARLIEAEAALHAGDVTTWKNTLNQLRTNGASSTVTYPASTVFDTAWVTGCTNNASLCTDSVPTGTSYAGFTINSVFTVTLTQGSPAWQVCWADAGSRASDCNNPVPVVVYSRAASSVTTYQAGTGGVNGLGPLTDPVDPAARVSLMFQERAYWLFLTGHRQGDLRRLLRQYSQYPAFASQQHVYPTGPYLAPGAGQYGSDVTVPIPTSEEVNPNFHGCIDYAP